MESDTEEQDPILWNRVGIGILTAVSLHHCIFVSGSIVTAWWERNHKLPVVYGESPGWLTLWAALLLFVTWRSRPRLVEWVPFFTLFVGFWLLGVFTTSWHPDSTEEAEVAAFCQAMFLTCLAVWGLAVLLAVVRWGLRQLGIGRASEKTEAD